MSAPVPFPQVGQLLDAASAAKLVEALVTIQQLSGEAAAILIERMDAIEGDPDAEDAIGLEDDFTLQIAHLFGPGCPIADPGGCEHDGRELEGATFAMHDEGG